MHLDLHAFRRTKLEGILKALESAFENVEEAKQKRDKEARREAEREMKRAARQVVDTNPHLAFLWFWAKREEADKQKDERAKKKFSEIANAIRDAWRSTLKAGATPEDFHIVPDVTAVLKLPLFSFMLHIPFRLKKPYMSKDERDFYLIDNPLRREKIFQVPLVAPTSWKGALRAALWQLGYEDKHEATIRLLGNPRESEEQRAGRLHFFPTFFDAIGLEVINPHDRKTGVGARGPILMECVPPNTKGDLLLLYVPFGFAEEEEKRRAEIAEDLIVLAKGIQAMLTEYGFGAKTSSGYGVARDELANKGSLLIRAKLAREDVTEITVQGDPKTPNLPRYLESPTRLISDLRREDGSLKSEEEYRRWVESRGKKYKKKERQLYAKARKWWEQEGRVHWEKAKAEIESSAESKPSGLPQVTKYAFKSLSELQDLAQRVADQLQEGGER